MPRDSVPIPTSHHHGVRAEPIGFLATLPELPAMTSWNARHGFANLLDRRGISGVTQGERETVVHFQGRKTPAGKLTQVRVAVAKSRAEIEAARHLVRQRYQWRGYEVEFADDRCAENLVPQRFAHEITIVAEHREATIGTVTLGLDGPLGLRAEETHGAVIQTARMSGRRVCELTRLAVAESADSKSVLASMFGLAYTAGRTIHDVTDVFIEVNPRHVTYYSRIMGFVVAAGERLCERVRAPSVLLHLEVDTLAARLETMADAAVPQSSLGEAA